MGDNSLRERLLAKRAEIDRALLELDWIESLADGQLSEGEPAAPDADKSIAQAVFEELVDRRLTLEQIAKSLRITPKQAHYALTGHRLRKVVESSKAGGVIRYTIPSEDAGERGDDIALPALSDAILAVLGDERGKVWKTKELVRELDGRCRTRATNFAGAVSSTLSNLAKAERIEKVKDGYSAKAQRGKVHAN